MHKISIVIPVYNVDQYLPQCLDSVIHQTYQNLEIILVNDGSTDSCPKICDDYALKDDRIKVIHKGNGGLSDARNAGLKIVTGNFISFIDSDDLLSVNFCQILIQTLIENNADIVECGFTNFETDVELEKMAIPVRNTEIYTAEIAVELLMKEYLKQMVWNKIYRKEVMSNFQFPVGKINEDEYWTYKVFGSSKKIVKITDVLYFYRQQTASIMGKEYAIKRLDGLPALEERIDYMQENFPNLENLAIKTFSFMSLWHYQKIAKNSEIDADGNHRNEIVKNAKKYLPPNSCKIWSAKEIFWINFFTFAPTYCAKLRNLLKIGI